MREEAKRIGIPTQGELLDAMKEKTGITDKREFRRMQHMYFREFAEFMLDRELPGPALMDAATAVEEEASITTEEEYDDTLDEAATDADKTARPPTPPAKLQGLVIALALLLAIAIVVIIVLAVRLQSQPGQQQTMPPTANPPASSVSTSAARARPLLTFDALGGCSSIIRGGGVSPTRRTI